jgi:hypothetical protein
MKAYSITSSKTTARAISPAREYRGSKLARRRRLQYYFNYFEVFS